MRECELELLRTIRDSEDPDKAIALAVDVLQRIIAGEDAQSIAASYGVKLEEVASA